MCAILLSLKVRKREIVFETRKPRKKQRKKEKSTTTGSPNGTDTQTNVRGDKKGRVTREKKT
jgi:hypothetical protein